MKLIAFLFALSLLAQPLHAEDPIAEGEGEKPLPYVEVPVNLNGMDYKAEIDISGAEPVVVNGVDLDLSDHVPGAVRISRADGKSMADEGFRAREVLQAACATQGLRVTPGVVPVLTPAGRWIFAKGCE
jgi:hypothetical protein